MIDYNLIVSIHALLAECDVQGSSNSNPGSGFNPRTPCGVRQSGGSSVHPLARFQSTHSLRSATCCQHFLNLPAKFQSTHSLRSATAMPGQPSSDLSVSIHALLAECDKFQPEGSVPSGEFQSTHSLRSATQLSGLGPRTLMVSIHALLAECDFVVLQNAICPHCFNPRTPCGVRPMRAT